MNTMVKLNQTQISKIRNYVNFNYYFASRGLIIARDSKTNKYGLYYNTANGYGLIQEYENIHDLSIAVDAMVLTKNSNL